MNYTTEYNGTHCSDTSQTFSVNKVLVRGENVYASYVKILYISLLYCPRFRGIGIKEGVE